MKLSIALLSSLLFVTTISAMPSRAAQRSQKRNERRAGSEPATRVNDLKLGTGTFDAATTTNTNEIWSGAVLTAPPAGTTFTAVGATFVVPKPSPPTSGPGSWGGSAWVGIDGYYSNPNALLQSGVSWQVTVSDTDETTYEYIAWYEWIPDGEIAYAMNVTAGDTINVWCESTTNTTGYCTLEDVTTGVELTEVLSAPPPLPIPGDTTNLDGLSVEWIVEDFEEPDGTSIPFANFHKVTFTNCEAIANNVDGAWDPLYPNADNAVVQVMDQNGVVLTSTSFPGTNEIQVTYV